MSTTVSRCTPTRLRPHIKLLVTMRNRFRLVDPKLRLYLGRYIFQVLLATLALGAVLATEELISGGSVTSGILVAAVGSTAFTLFIMPHSDSARPRHALGGHLVALAVGAAISALVGTAIGERLMESTSLLFPAEAAVAVGLSMFSYGGHQHRAPSCGGHRPSRGHQRVYLGVGALLCGQCGRARGHPLVVAEAAPQPLLAAAPPG